MIRIRSVSALALLLWSNTAAATASADLIQEQLRAQPAHSAPAGGPCYDAGMPARFYAQRGHEPAWTRAQDIQQAHDVLAGATVHGMDPSRYRVDSADTRAPADAARADIALSAALLRYLGDLHCGRIVTAYSQASVAARRAGFDPALALAGALGEHRVAELAAAAAPQDALYGRVQQALAQLHARRESTARAPPITDPRAAIRPGAPFPEADALRRRLAELDGIDAAAMEPAPPRYTPELVQAVQAFQQRHGLREDGVLDRATRDALAVPLQQRIRQLALTLERLRWLPPLPPGRSIVVNVPAYRLLAFDSGAPEREPLAMRVIVGKAVSTPTPLFVGQLRDIELNPYWNVPSSIARKEILPRLARDPGYLARHGFERVPAGAGGATRIRQRPGRRNALGAVKFVMPNPMDIYLHATPAQDLFRRSRRDFSHGCIRVELPLELAEFALAQQRWTTATLAAAIAGGRTQRLALPAAIPVVLMYATAIVEPDGRLHFYDDVYGLDAQLDRALSGAAR